MNNKPSILHRMWDAMISSPEKKEAMRMEKWLSHMCGQLKKPEAAKKSDQALDLFITLESVVTKKQDYFAYISIKTIKKLINALEPHEKKVSTEKNGTPAHEYAPRINIALKKILMIKIKLENNKAPRDKKEVIELTRKKVKNTPVTPQPPVHQKETAPSRLTEKDPDREDVKNKTDNLLIWLKDIDSAIIKNNEKSLIMIQVCISNIEQAVKQPGYFNNFAQPGIDELSRIIMVIKTALKDRNMTNPEIINKLNNIIDTINASTDYEAIGNLGGKAKVIPDDFDPNNVLLETQFPDNDKITDELNANTEIEEVYEVGQDDITEIKYDLNQLKRYIENCQISAKELNDEMDSCIAQINASEDIALLDSLHETVSRKLEELDDADEKNALYIKLLDAIENMQIQFIDDQDNIPTAEIMIPESKSESDELKDLKHDLENIKTDINNIPYEDLKEMQKEVKILLDHYMEKNNIRCAEVMAEILSVINIKSDELNDKMPTQEIDVKKRFGNGISQERIDQIEKMDIKTISQKITEINKMLNNGDQEKSSEQYNKLMSLHNYMMHIRAKKMRQQSNS